MKSFDELQKAIEIVEKAEKEARREESRKARQDKAVVRGIIRRKPVNNEASKLLAKSPWYHHAPSIKKTKDKTMAKQSITGESLQKPQKTPDQAPPMMYKMSDIAKLVTEDLIKRCPKEMTELARASYDARSVIEETVKGIGTVVDSFDELMKESNSRIRAERMTVVAEVAQIMKSLKEIRTFFLGPDYREEQRQLKEFIELCERLKVLKDSGFLDQVADTMIRLAP